MERPVLLVARPDTPCRWDDVLEREGCVHVSVSGHEALEAVRQASAHWVLCERVPGWQALVRGVQDAGGGVVLLGAPLDPAERRQLASHVPELAATPEMLPSALARVRDARVGSSEPDILARLTRFAESLADQTDLEGLVQALCARTREVCDADGAVIFLVDEKGALRVEGPYRGVAARAQRELADLAARQARSVREDASASIAVPLLKSGDVVGIVAVYRSAVGASFSEAEVRLLEQLARPVTAALLNAQAHDQLRRAQARVIADNASLERQVEERTARIAEGAREWERTFDAIREPLAIQDGFILRRVNRAYADRAGISIEQIPGMTCHQALAGRDSPCEGCPLARGSASAGEVCIKGGQYAFSAFRRSLDAEDPTVITHYRDITAQRELERKLRETERMASLGQLASGAAHEINNPLGFIISNLGSLKEVHLALRESVTEWMVNGALTPGELRANLERLLRESDLDEGLEMIEESLAGAERVASIVRGLRDLARLEIHSEDAASVSDSVTRVIRAELSGAARPLHVELRASGKARLPPLHLDQILTQLLRNARQATSEGGRIEIRSRDEADFVAVEVEDEGCGIAPEHLPRIFEPFFTARGVGAGIGLGLTSAYGIAQRHGGSLEARSELGKGSRFTLRVPRVQGAAGETVTGRPPDGAQVTLEAALERPAFDKLHAGRYNAEPA